MRKEFAESVIHYFDKYPNQVFLTGDLGFMALEKVKERFNQFFINAGVAEQNMISMAAAIASEGFVPWVYSIAPFVTLRPYEQIRNDVCFHNLPVKLVGNGGGYGYGIMGATHHSLEDIGAMRLMPNMKIFLPLTNTDVKESVELMLIDKQPNYLRLNLSAAIPIEIEKFKQWRKIKNGDKAVIISAGPVLDNIFKLDEEILNDLEVWSLGILPITELPDEMLRSISEKRNVIVIEEHYEPGGIGEMISKNLLHQLKTSIRFNTLFARGYITGRYGNQQWHQQENDLSGAGLKNKISHFLYESE